MTSDATPVNPPIPVPDVPGADAGTGGLPERSALPARQRFIVDTSAITDIGLRTAVASIISAAVTPAVAAAVLRHTESLRERNNLRFYAEVASTASR